MLLIHYAPVFAQADVGTTMGAAGTDARIAARVALNRTTGASFRRASV